MTVLGTNFADDPDKRKNAQGQRALRATPLAAALTQPVTPGGVAPLLQKLIKDYAMTGLPPAYLPKDPVSSDRKAS